MQITSQIEKYTVLNSSSLRESLLKIDSNQSGCVFVVDSQGRMVGMLTDGDFRRWLTSSNSSDLNAVVEKAMNTDFTWCSVGTSPREIAMHFKPSFKLIPLLDQQRHLVALAIRDLDGIEVAGRIISDSSPSYLIAEIGNNHNGSLKHAKELIDEAVAAGADCAKFQMRDLRALYKNDGQTRDDSADLGAQYVFNLLEKFQLTNEELIECFDYCKRKGVTPLCTPWDESSLAVLEDYGMPAYKVASADFTNLPFLQTLADTGKPLFCSTGMSTESEVITSVAFLQKHAAQFVLLHCNSTYPAPLKDVNLRYLARLKELSGGLVGYSGHELGIDVSIAAVAMGAKVVEKHFTMDKSMEGNDHKVSLLPEEFAKMVTSIRGIEEALGTTDERVLSQGEMMNRETLAKSLVSTVDIQKGQRITREMIEVKGPGQGLQPYKLDELIGSTAVRNISAGDFFFQADIDGELSEGGNYKFNRPFGVPVRYHDYASLSAQSNLDFVEFHLSFQDLEVDLNDYFTQPQSIGLAVHSPELFSNDHIIDFASNDSDYLAVSRANLLQVIEMVRDLKNFFPNTKKPVIVLNAGGATDKGFLEKSKTQAMYNQVAEQLARIDQHGVEVIIQTMPPFPWHFGGQRYHNLFVDPDEIVTYCEANNTRLCLDVSHTMMACNYYGWSLKDYINKVGPYVAHMHISDAQGDSGEGVQMGQGDVDFSELGALLDQHCQGVMFIPEIWQGHKNNGQGFWQALNYLQQYL